MKDKQPTWTMTEEDKIHRLISARSLIQSVLDETDSGASLCGHCGMTHRLDRSAWHLEQILEGTVTRLSKAIVNIQQSALQENKSDGYSHQEKTEDPDRDPRQTEPGRTGS